MGDMLKFVANRKMPIYKNSARTKVIFLRWLIEKLTQFEDMR